MSRRHSSSDVAIDLGIARSTDFVGPPNSSRVSPKWRAPRPVSWPPALPDHRIPASAPRSAPPNRFHEPVLHAPLLMPPVEPRKKARVGVWVTLLLLVAVGVGGFVFRGPLAVEAALVTDWARHQVPSDFAERPRLAWDRVQEFVGEGVSRVRALIPGSRKVQAPVPMIPTPSSDKGPSSVGASPPNENASPSAAPPEIAFSALPPAAPPPRPAPRARSSAPLQDPPAPDQPAAPAAPVHVAPAPPARAAIPAPEPAPTTVAPAPVSAPAPEPGSLDDLIRKTVERESHQKH
jgi:hypothetical protein